ncbi:uncharacterized protein CLUP02_12252 [Colletotrichum lupini]|uniref:Uncharacterized protein n=1 Tax=Colletotrichum lupini TaxID=145971 RepID=A0A9Q8WL79_9PEZI|nr:uncharacterized protein CLUP02_12252 [Colletotrichum lupini]UQC86750.1 hypothetical protein CLUP02_12252 [Colletotrichum lupini]
MADCISLILYRCANLFERFIKGYLGTKDDHLKALSDIGRWIYLLRVIDPMYVLQDVVYHFALFDKAGGLKGLGRLTSSVMASNSQEREMHFDLTPDLECARCAGDGNGIDETYMVIFSLVFIRLGMLSWGGSVSAIHLASASSSRLYCSRRREEETGINSVKNTVEKFPNYLSLEALGHESSYLHVGNLNKLQIPPFTVRNIPFTATSENLSSMTDPPDLILLARRVAERNGHLIPNAVEFEPLKGAWARA